MEHAAPRARGSYARYWCFTENADTDAFVRRLRDDGLPDPGVTYLCGQLEVATTGRVHFQGYLELSVRQRLPYLKRVLSPTAHFEVRQGTQLQAIEYCRKEETAVADTFVEFGTKVPDRLQDKTDHLMQVKALIDEGCSKEDIAKEEFSTYIRYHAGIDKVISFRPLPTRPSPTKTYLLHGRSGSGKSTYAHTKWPDAYVKPPGHKWFSGYRGESVVFMDEFAGNWFTLDVLLRLIDPLGLPFDGEIKGAHVPILARKYVITSQFYPDDWYKLIERDRMVALKRRFTKLIEFDVINGDYGKIVQRNPWGINGQNVLE